MSPRRSSGHLSPADAVTILNAIFGFLAIALLVRDWAYHPHQLLGGIEVRELKLAGGLIALGALCDVADGFVARATWSSALGNELDIMADAITFGAAPGLLIVVAGFAFPTPVDGLALAAAMSYIVAVVVRLARHAVAAHSPSDGFVGITSPAGALGVIAVLALGLGPAGTVAGVLVVSALMVVPMHYPHQSHPAMLATLLAFVGVGIAVIAGVLSLRVASGLGLLAIVLIPVVARVADSAHGQAARLRRSHIGLASHDE